jgi:hypothetical protein
MYSSEIYCLLIIKARRLMRRTRCSFSLRMLLSKSRTETTYPSSTSIRHLQTSFLKLHPRNQKLGWSKKSLCLKNKKKSYRPFLRLLRIKSSISKRRHCKITCNLSTTKCQLSEFRKVPPKWLLSTKTLTSRSKTRINKYPLLKV